MPGAGNDPFSGSSVQNLLQHTISPKVVIDEEGTGYVVKSDLINIDNIYISGSIISSAPATSNIIYLKYATSLYRTYYTTPSPGFTLTGLSGYAAIPNTLSPTITSGKTYLVSVNITYTTATPLAGDNIFFTLGNGPSTPTGVNTPILYPFTTNGGIGYTTLTGIFVSNGVAPQIFFNWNCLSDISNRNFLIETDSFGCIQLN